MIWPHTTCGRGQNVRLPLLSNLKKHGELTLPADVVRTSDIGTTMPPGDRYRAHTTCGRGQNVRPAPLTSAPAATSSHTTCGRGQNVRHVDQDSSVTPEQRAHTTCGRGQNVRRDLMIAAAKPVRCSHYLRTWSERPTQSAGRICRSWSLLTLPADVVRTSDVRPRSHTTAPPQAHTTCGRGQNVRPLIWVNALNVEKSHTTCGRGQNVRPETPRRRCRRVRRLTLPADVVRTSDYEGRGTATWNRFASHYLRTWSERPTRTAQAACRAPARSHYLRTWSERPT